ncbi:phosphatidylglycerophosphatase [Thermococcus siculi]|uniref:Phosphatidylglycerophosphatase n=1 Tax=Thermococcus siculi TaxID=72803 RepID=A0A2Z2MPR5_9EURY|nr:phosphatase PAP2 family protein [Thermococcus siculi]ASJ09361.1 phosphatidylglycerophosphatase [Thermococcus siculi]
MTRVKLDRNFLILTVIVAGILLLQATGAFDGLNERVNSTLPLVDTPLVNFLTALGGDLFLIPFAALVVYLDWRGKGTISRKTLAFLLATIVGLVTVGGLKLLFAEPRPRPEYGTYAFPSGHAFRAAVIAAYASDRWRKYAFIAWIYAVTVALTRLLLHYHWFSDVLFSLFFAPWLYLLLKSLLGVKPE